MFNFPPLIEMTEYRGNFTDYLEATYAIFKQDFITTKPVFRGIKLGLKSYPLVVGKSYTYYHMTHSGDISYVYNSLMGCF